jgi:YD repeat-containing protein
MPAPGLPPPTPPTCECYCFCINQPGSVLRDNSAALGNLPQMRSPRPVRYFDGVALMAETDLSSDGFGTPWGQTRSWSIGPGSTYAYGSWNGEGWVDTQLPHLVRGGSEGEPDTPVVAVFNANDPRYFDLAGDGSYQDRFFDQSKLVHNTTGTNHEFDLTDSSGDVIRFDDFSSSQPCIQRGQFEGFTDPAGNSVSVWSHSPGGQVTEVRRSGPSGGGTVVESYVYEYLHAPDPNSSQLQRVTLRRQLPGSSDWSVVRKVQYTYYVDGIDLYGNTGDLKTAQVLDANDNVLDTSYYRYYTPGGDPHGYIGALKYVLNPASYARLAADPGVGNPLTATDNQVAPYADNYFEYDPSSGRVTREDVQGAGCSACAGGVGTFTYTYTPSHNTPGYNSWSMKTVERTLPDLNTNTVYTNAYGEVMLSVYHDTASNLDWPTFYQYDNQGRLLLQADPSAVLPPAQGDSYDRHPDLLNDQGPPNGYQYLARAAGQIMRWDYYTMTTAGDPAQGGQAGGVAGYLQDTQLQRGQSGTPVPQEAWQYFRHQAAGATDVPVATDTVYGLDHGTAADYSDRDPRTTRYAPTWFSGTVQEQSLTITQPAIATSQNGPGPGPDQFDVQTTYNDTYGRPVWARDGDGFVTYTAYDQATGAVTKTITDVNYASLSAAEQASFDATGWPRPLGGLHLVTSMVVDGLGRTVQQTDPNGHLTYTAYQDAAHLVATYPGWTAAGPTGPTQVSREDRPGGYTETFTASTAGTAWDPTLLQYLDPVSHRPTGGEFTDPNNVYAGAGLQTLSRDYTNDAGQRVRSDAYVSFAGLTYATTPYIGTANTNYYTTQYAYDERGRPNKTVSPNLTISRTVYDGLGRVVSTWVGINDMPATGYWSPSNPAGMTQTQAYYYDQPGGALDVASGVGDGDLTQMTEYPSGNPYPDQPPADRRSTQSFYDWRDRAVATKEGALAPASSEDIATHRPITVRTYDNLGEVTQQQRYDGDRVAVAVSADGNGVTLTPPSGTAAARPRAQTATSYDDQGRVYPTQVYSVDPSTGMPSANALETDDYYGHRGQSLAEYAPGGLTTKWSYDGAGRPTVQYRTDAGALNRADHSGRPDLSWSGMSGVGNDVVLEQTDTQYDGVGQAILVSTRQRFHDAATQNQASPPVTATGPLGNPGTDTRYGPRARVYYSASWYDAADRLAAQADYGTNGGTPLTSRPAQPPRTDPSVQNGTVLLTEYAYTPAGWVGAQTDPGGLVRQTRYDALGRVTQTIENLQGDGSVVGSGSNRTTRYSYDGDGHVLTVQALVLNPNGTNPPPGQTTRYVYGVVRMLDGGTSRVSSNDLLAQVQHPNLATGEADANPADYQQDNYAYDALGETTSKSDRNQSAHAYSYGVLGRPTADAVTALGAAADGSWQVDGAVRRLETAYDGQGNASLFTSYDAAAGGNIVNQVLRQYNGLGQLTAEYQSHAGAVVTGGANPTPAVQYAYSQMQDQAGQYVNHSRLTGITYPTASTALTYTYAAGLDDTISRLTPLSEGARVLESYSYLGLGTAVQRLRPQPAADLSYVQQAGDPWAPTGAGDQYTGLDRFGRVVDQFWLKTGTLTATDRFQYGYDADGNRLYRANLASPSSPGFDELYGSDGLNQVTSFGRGTLNATRTALVGSASRSQSWQLDTLGNWTSVATVTNGVPQNESRSHNQQNQVTTAGPLTLGFDSNGNTTQYGRAYRYGAWDRLVQVNGGAQASYAYDALGRRVTETHPSSGRRDLYYSADWQVLEERVGPDVRAQNVQAQNVWSPVYLVGTKVTDAGLPYLQGLTKLKKLDLYGTKVTDAGLARLKGLSGLEKLSLGGTKVTDASLAHLRGLTRLKELGLERHHGDSRRGGHCAKGTARVHHPPLKPCRQPQESPLPLHLPLGHVVVDGQEARLRITPQRRPVVQRVRARRHLSPERSIC